MSVWESKFDNKISMDNNNPNIPNLFGDFGDPTEYLSRLVDKKIFNYEQKNDDDIDYKNVDKSESLDIVPFKTNKSKIKTTTNMNNGVICKHPASIIFNGKSGSGKSNLLLNLLTRPQFYKDYFDLIFFFSPSCKCDDLPKYLDLPEKRMFDTFDEENIQGIFDTQKDIIKENGIANSPKILIIFDDVQSEQKFLRSKIILTAYIRNRHLNISTWLCGQSWTKLPRACRLQASGIYFFPGSQSEMDHMIEEYTPPNCNKKKFEQILKYATKDKHNFLFINNQQPFEDRYRKNMTEIININ
jgi:hypothetical protein